MFDVKEALICFNKSKISLDSFTWEELRARLDYPTIEKIVCHNNIPENFKTRFLDDYLSSKGHIIIVNKDFWQPYFEIFLTLKEILD